MAARSSSSQWGSSFRLTAAEKWKAKSAAMGRHVTATLVEYARPQTGMQVLDLASGTGEPAISLAPLVAPGGHVTALDLSTELLEIADGRARDRGLINFSVCHADAASLPFDDRSFDLVTSRFGVMFFGEGGLREAHRVLKPGARACFAAWGPFAQPYWSSTMGIVHQYAGGSRTAPECDPFKYEQCGSLSVALRRAGFEAEEEIREVPWTWPGTAEEVWEYAQAVGSPFLPMLQRVPAEKWRELNPQVLAALRRYVGPEGVEFGARIVLASGTKM
jgi:ubiquinone/menaquinone biosynthesis C-methylase UbiE